MAKAQGGGGQKNFKGGEMPPLKPPKKTLYCIGTVHENDIFD